jgi:hypothetical protein
VAVPLKQRQQLLARKMKKHAKVAAASVAPRDVKAAAMASAVMVAVVDATAAVANAAKARPAKSAHPAKVVVVVKAVAKDVLKVVTNCAKAKHVPHAANVLSEVNVLSALRAIVLPAKAAARVVARTAPKAAVMHSQS